MTRRRQTLTEFVTMIAMMFATTAFSIDAMLPALPRIASDLGLDDPNRAQLILTAFVLGAGIGTFFAGPLSDAMGRKPVILGGLALYSLGSVLASVAKNLDLVLAARMLQGLGVSGPRIVSVALIRDLYSGREMARIVSFATMIFALVPALAPAIGMGIIWAGGWRGLFGAFVLFAVIEGLWFALRQPETLAPAARKPLRTAELAAAFRECLSHRVVIVATLVQTLIYGALFATLSSTQAIFAVTFDRGASFPFWYALIAILAGGASLLNARLVMRFGLRHLVSAALGAEVALSLAAALVTQAGLWPEGTYFAAYMVWTFSIFAMVGLTLGNLSALALEPLGHVAGMAASVTGAVFTILSVPIAAPIGLAFNGTPVPLMASTFLLCLAGLLAMRLIPR